MENLNWYNTQVRLRISDMYCSVGEQIQELHKSLIYIQRRLSDPLLPHVHYERLLEDQKRIEDNLVKLEIEREIWSQAREICLEGADEMV